MFSISGLRLYFSELELWVVWSVIWSTNCSFAHPAPQSATSLGPPAIALLRVLSAWLPVSVPLPVWMNVFSLTPWLSEFHTVRFSVSCGCFLFLNLLLSFFWLCEESQCVYLHLHLGWKAWVYLGNFDSVPLVCMSWVFLFFLFFVFLWVFLQLPCCFYYYISVAYLDIRQ